MRRKFYISSLQTITLFLLLLSSGLAKGHSVYGYVVSGDSDRELVPWVATLDQGMLTELPEEAYKPKEAQTAEDMKKLAISYADEGNAQLSTFYLLEYINTTGDLSIINDHLFEPIVTSTQYQNIVNTFQPRISFLSGFYIFAGFLGLLVFFLLILRPGRHRIGNVLIGLFIAIHSVFILHLSVYITNTQFYLPDTLFVSTIFSFLYGPLMYFYFKRVTISYSFRKTDLLHLLPTLGLIIVLLPYLLMSPMEKFEVLYNQGNILMPMANTIIVIKLASLLIYGVLSLELYRTHSIGNRNRNIVLWQRNMLFIYCAYIVSYCLYSGIVTGMIPFPGLVHIFVLVMVALVFYVGYISYEQPEIFVGKVSLVDPTEMFKYRKSRLTTSFSHELKEQLSYLLDEEKIYKQNDLNLEVLAEKLGTNRHNTSQVINEHFGMNFFELINKYRIDEAMRLLESRYGEDMSIIEVAYEVGFNNKVTFNKSFKKFVSKTPTQFLLSLQG